ncbi:hypothetical protein IMSAGC013_01405 [Lachnospiraceae bacterium]|nr:GNAT family N-acetyltransferase [Lachnospiraceae bacterium]GFI30018.1 hypothetical protein IMSAGC013_01405 [Lachnospiraceae bacterium]
MSAKVSNLSTERLFLREITEKDTALIVTFRSDPEVYQYFLSPHPLTEEEHLNWFRTRYLSDDNCMNWAAALKDSGETIGVFGIKRQESEHTAEVSYILSPEFQGKGYAGEAVEGMIRFASEEWHCRFVSAQIHVENQKSAAFAKGLGFECFGRRGKFELYRKVIM